MATAKQSRFVEFLKTPAGYLVIVDWMLFAQAVSASGPHNGKFGNGAAILFAITIIVSIPYILLLRKGHRLTRAAYVLYACLMITSIAVMLVLVAIQTADIVKGFS